MVAQTEAPSRERIAEVLNDWPDVVLRLKAHEAFALIGQLQIAIYHPENRGVTLQVALRIIHALKTALPVEVRQLVDSHL